MSDFKLQLGLLKFEDVRVAIKNYFKDVKGIEYYDGNNFSILVDALSYLQEMMAYQLSQQANNVYSRSTNDRIASVENAYKLGYTPHRKIPNRIIISGYDYESQTSDLLFYGQRTGLPYTIYKPTESDLTKPPVAHQEQEQILSVASTGLENQKILIPTSNVSDKDIIVNVDGYVYTKFDIYDLIPAGDSEIYFVNESETEFFTEITFGNGIIGKIPPVGANIEITYFESMGEDGNDEVGLYDDTSDLLDGCTFVSTNTGKDHEIMESININATKYHSARGRLVTKNDYENFFKGYFKNVDVSENTTGLNYYYAGNIYVSIVGNELIRNENELIEQITETDPNNFSSTKLFHWNEVGDSISYLNNLSSNTLVDDVDKLNRRKILGTDVIYTSPTYMYNDITPIIIADIDGYRFTRNELLRFRNVLMNYSLNNLFGFDRDFFTDYLSKELFNESDIIKAIRYDIDYNIVFDNLNLYDSYILNLPEDFVASNDDYYNLDNNILGIYYNRPEMPIHRHTINSKIKSGTDTQTSISFDRYLIATNINLLDDTRFRDSLIFDVIEGNIINIQSFPVFNNGSNLLNIDIETKVITNTIIFANNQETFNIGKLVNVGNSYYLELDSLSNGTNIDWSNFINYEVRKLSDRFRIHIKYSANLKVGASNNNPHILIDSKKMVGKLYIKKNNILDIEGNLGNFSVSNVNDSTLKFELEGSEYFRIIRTNTGYQVNMVDGSILEGIETPIVVNDFLFFYEKGVHGTIIGEYDIKSSRIIFSQLLAANNNPNITDIITLKDYIEEKDLMDDGIKYLMNIKPKYYIENDVLKYKQHFNKKSGLYKTFNINNCRNS